MFLSWKFLTSGLLFWKTTDRLRFIFFFFLPICTSFCLSVREAWHLTIQLGVSLFRKTLNITGTSTDICAIPFLETFSCCGTNHSLPLAVFHLLLISISTRTDNPFYAWILSFLKSIFEIQVNCCLPGFILLLLYARLPWHSKLLFYRFFGWLLKIK